jgi:hypothetical protein
MTYEYPDNPYLAFLEQAEEFFCYVRSWWDGAAVDAACWWRDTDDPTVHHRLILSGESWEPIAPRVVKDSKSTVKVLADLLRAFEGAGLESEPVPFVMSNADVWYGSKTRSQAAARWVFIRCGIHSNTDAQMELLAKIHQYCPRI